MQCHVDKNVTVYRAASSHTFLTLSALRRIFFLFWPYILQCRADATWWHCASSIELVLLVCVSQYFSSYSMCGSVCSLVPLCKFKEWATWTDNSIPMMHHAAWCGSSFTKLAMWNGGPLLTATGMFFSTLTTICHALQQSIFHCWIFFLIFLLSGKSRALWTKERRMMHN